jgi:hypothetical protein
MANTALMKRVLQQVTEHPETHDQGSTQIGHGPGLTRDIGGWSLFFAHEARNLHCSPYVDVLDDSFPEPILGTAEALGIGSAEAQEIYAEEDNDKAVVLLQSLISKYSAAGPRVVDVWMDPAQRETGPFRHADDDCGGTIRRYGSGWRCDVCRAVDFGKQAAPMLGPAQAERQKITDQLFDRARNELDTAKALWLFELALKIERGEE